MMRDDPSAPTLFRFGAARVVEAAPRPLLSMRRMQGTVLCSSSEPLPCRTTTSAAVCEVQEAVLSQECRSQRQSMHQESWQPMRYKDASRNRLRRWSAQLLVQCCAQFKPLLSY